MSLYYDGSITIYQEFKGFGMAFSFLLSQVKAKTSRYYFGLYPTGHLKKIYFSQVIDFLSSTYSNAQKY